MNPLNSQTEVSGTAAMSLPSTTGEKKPWEVFKDTQRFIPAPDRPYPSLAEGQSLLGMADAEFKELYLESQARIRTFLQTKPPSKGKRIRYGQRVENHEDIVVPLEAAFPVLKCCSGNWGAKWILRRAKQVIGAKATSARSRNQAMFQQLEEASQQAEVAGPGAQEPGLEPGLEPEDPLSMLDVEPPVIVATRFPDIDLGHYANLTDDHEKIVGLDNPDWQSERPIQGECLEPDFDGHFLVDRDACTALFNKSKAWLVAGPSIRYG